MGKKEKQGKSRRSRGKKLNIRQQKLKEATEKFNQKERTIAIELEETLMQKLSKKKGGDFIEAIQETEEDYRQELKKLQQDMEALRKEAKEINARQMEQFDRELALALGKGGLGELIKKAYHNPVSALKLATDWQGETSPPLGLYGGIGGDHEIPTASAEYQFDEIDDPNFGPYCDTIHPFCAADAGSRRGGNAYAWVTQRLTFTHPPPHSSILINTVSIILSAFGWGEASPSSAFHLLLTPALRDGGISRLLMSVSVEQDITWPNGLEDTIHVDIVEEDELASFEARGSRFWGMRPSCGWAWGAVTLKGVRRSYPTTFPLYSSQASAAPVPMPSGGPVRVNVEFRCDADADNRDASAFIEFNDQRQKIRVHSVMLEYSEG